jgi:hypothetical protein
VAADRFGDELRAVVAGDGITVVDRNATKARVACPSIGQFFEGELND